MEVRRGMGSPGTGVPDSRVLLCGCWKLNLGSLQEQSVLLVPEPSLQSLTSGCLLLLGLSLPIFILEIKAVTSWGFV